MDGIWEFLPDPEDAGVAGAWPEGLPGGVPIAVPASWNDQLPAQRDFLGPAWYTTTFEVPRAWAGRRVRLHFGSVTYQADTWLNGEPLGGHEGGHLPFTFDLDGALRAGANRLVVRVDGRLDPTHVPPGNLGPRGTFGGMIQRVPDTNFDFFPFAGIDRGVRLVATDAEAIEDVVVRTELDGTVHVAVSRPGAAALRLELRGHGVELSAALAAGEEETELRISSPSLWAPGAPNLYQLAVLLERNGQVVDSVALNVGVRTVAVDGDRLLLNGEPVVLRGFGRHEDFPVTGRGEMPAVMVRDFDLLRWTGANSFRASHYPYSETELDLADRLGVMVIAETSGVGLVFEDDAVGVRSELLRKLAGELVVRDRNHPSVVMWSLANEPRHTPGVTDVYFKDLADHVRNLDSTRPLTMASFNRDGEPSFAHMDVVSVNRYHGWYYSSGDLDGAIEHLEAELDQLHEEYGKPILVTEFGADAIAGHHAEPPEIFSEDYQAALIEAHIRLLQGKAFIAGQHIWTLCDFKTPQSVLRPHALNLKGVFTRDRRPKAAAHRVRALWSGATD
ncbi:MAG TPA: glycoside hydrolase family 2 TIM barrel-domain containing protein [Candidatus Solibacter sp.]|nr:glycoside hydrolase family 2 TIM barrel-domain containing protein [Candidatus Solibacter sp.]